MQVMEEEMTAQLQAKHRERTERRRGERNDHYGGVLSWPEDHARLGRDRPDSAPPPPGPLRKESRDAPSHFQLHYDA